MIVGSHASPLLLRDVIDEHFDDACFALQRFEAALESPIVDLAALASHPERRLVAHVDALVIGGETVQRDVLWPAFEQPTQDKGARATVAAWALLEAGEFAAVMAAVERAPEALPCAARAVQLTQNEALDGWLRHQVATLDTRTTARQVLLLEFAARRHIEPPNLMAVLQEPDLALTRAASRASRHGLAERYAPILQEYLGHTDAPTREAVLLSGLCLGLPRAWSVCEAWALSPEQPCAMATQLYAALGSRAQQARLAQLCTHGSARAGVLFALGFTGNAAFVPLLLDHLASKSALEAKLAMQSLAMIVGFAANDERLVHGQSPAAANADAALPPAEDDPEARATLPDFDDDDLEADLVPAPEQSLGAPNVSALRERCSAAASSHSRRLLWGEPLSLQSLTRALWEAPLRVRHTLASVLAVRTRGATWLDTRALTARQHRQLQAASRTAHFDEGGW